MIEYSVDSALADSVQEVLEKMFFVDLLNAGPGSEARPEGIAAQIRFEGAPPGSFRLDLEVEAARSAAADFVGEDPAELSAEQMNHVVCELANMICGSVLSRIESSATFRLSTPEIAGEPTACPPTAAEASFQASLGGGALRAEIRMERPVCPEIDESGS